MLHLILVEAALEIVPEAILRHPSVRRNAKRKRKKPQRTLLDRSLHHSAMKTLPDNHKRGRPDIVHICLLEALGTPLNKEGKLRVWLHAYGGKTIEVSPETRLPRDRGRFDSLMEQLFSEGRIPPEKREPLMTLVSMDLRTLIKTTGAGHTVALTSHGTPSNLEDVCRRLVGKGDVAVFIGAFPHGPLSEETLTLADEVLSIHPLSLETWVVTSRLVYEYERQWGSPYAQ
jgi:rRNA small subunit pseudouridine methyltransferase Nep1